MRRIMAMVGVAVILAACSGAGVRLDGRMDSVDFGGSDESPPVTEQAAAPGEERDGLVEVDVVSPTGRKVIRTARLELHASDTRGAYEEIGTIVTASGGYVARADVRPVDSEDAEPHITITVRIPTDRLGEVLGEIKGVADRVVSESQDSQDVSEQFVDLEARLTNLRALETELRALLEEVRQQPDADPEKLLRVFNELASVRGQIEQIEGQLQYLTNLTDLATVEVSVTQTPTAAPIVDRPWAPAEAFRNAARSLVDALQAIADGAITLIVYVVPIVIIVAALPASLGWWLYRRRRMRPAPPAPAAE